MKTRIKISLVAIAATMVTTGFAGPTLKKEIPISKAVETFNEQALLDPIGKNERPITEEEVIASIFFWQRPHDAPVEDGLLKQFKKIATTKTLPENAKFESLNGIDHGEEHLFDIWSVRIRIDRPDGSSYAFQIRQRVVGARTLHEELARLDNYIKAENVESWIGGYRILERRKEIAGRIENQASE